MRQFLIESDPHQTRVAVLEEGQLVEVFIERHAHPSLAGNIYRGRITRVVPGIDAAFVDIGLERDAFLVTADDLAEAELSREGPREGDGVLVQLKREPRAGKGARVSRAISLAARRLVLGPGLAHRGVSRRIASEEERERLRLLVEELGEPEDGLIVRTAATGSRREELEAELESLRDTWQSLAREAKRSTKPALVWAEEPLEERLVRDRVDRSDEVLVADRDLADRLEALLERHAIEASVRLREEGETLFELFGLEEQIQAGLKPRVWLPSGGTVVIQPTEALVSIDVNTGRFVGSRELEATALATNLEAARAIARQLRLRNLAGIIVVDFIDMREPGHREQVYEAFRVELERDPTRTRLLEMSEFGLVQVTRKRSRPSLHELLTGSCRDCYGTGRVGGVVETCLRLRRALLARATSGGPALVARINPRLLEAIDSAESAILDEVRATLGPNLKLVEDESLRQDEFTISLA